MSIDPFKRQLTHNNLNNSNFNKPSFLHNSTKDSERERNNSNAHQAKPNNLNLLSESYENSRNVNYSTILKKPTLLSSSNTYNFNKTIDDKKNILSSSSNYDSLSKQLNNNNNTNNSRNPNILGSRNEAITLTGEKSSLFNNSFSNRQQMYSYKHLSNNNNNSKINNNFKENAEKKENKYLVNYLELNLEKESKKEEINKSRELESVKNSNSNNNSFLTGTRTVFNPNQVKKINLKSLSKDGRNESSKPNLTKQSTYDFQNKRFISEDENKADISLNRSNVSNSNLLSKSEKYLVPSSLTNKTKVASISLSHQPTTCKSNN
jgi:hypothetical protein